MNNSNNLLRTVLKPPKRPFAQNRTNEPSYNNQTKSFDFSPVHWTAFFEECRDLNVDESKGTFRVYLNGFKDQSISQQNAPVLVLLHGAGYSALTFSLFVKSIIDICDCKIVAIDLRGHGSTRTENDDDLSVSTIVDDIFNVLVNLFNETSSSSSSIVDHHQSSSTTITSDNVSMNDIAYKPIDHQIRLPTMCIIGHSMGGAIAVHTTYKLSTVCTISGLIVIDVVEGTALDALQSMHLVLKNRQTSFNSIQDGIEWCVRNNQTKNIDAARISFPGQIKNRFTNKTATDEYELNKEPFTTTTTTSTTTSLHQNDHDRVLAAEKMKECKITDDSIAEEDEEMIIETTNTPQVRSTTNTADEFKRPSISKDQPVDNSSGKYVWRINLFKSEPYWRSWFENLSKLFLSAPTNGRLLLLAGIDRLDKDLTIGQMQGKFQMQVLPQCGHAVQEDVPDKVAEAVATYLIRNKLAQKKKEFEPTFPCC